MEFQKLNSFDELDKKKFSELVFSGFGRNLVKGYFSYCNPSYIVLCSDEGEYAGAIVVEQIPQSEGIHYLDKIVVGNEYQGQGLGKNLWSYLNGDSDKLIWRSNQENPINEFYLSQCEGLQKEPPWWIFWYGLTPSELELGISYCFSKKSTLE